jgi:hypothetical protein
MTEQQNIERLIIIGMISQTEFLKEIREIYSVNLIESVSAKRIATWCIEYFDKYNKAPDQDIEGIYFEKIRNLPDDLVQDISDILSDLSETATESQTDLTYLIDQTKQRFTERHLFLYQEKIQNSLLKGRTKEANELAQNFKPLVNSKRDSLNLGSKKALTAIDKAFKEASEPLITYPKQLGQFWNGQFVRGGFVAFLAPEKRGKSFLLMDLVNRATNQGKRVAFFQAGDMSESQQLRRFCIHLAKRSDKEKYCSKHFQPIRDCVRNQKDECNLRERESQFGVFESFSEDQIRNEITIDQLMEAYQENPTYKPCWNCKEYSTQKIGAVWLEEILKVEPLDAKTAKRIFHRHYVKTNRQLMLSSHANGTLSVAQIKAILDGWERSNNFLPDVIVIDYADLLVPSTKQEFRHQQNEIWKELRNLSQEYRGENQPLVITVTQADATSYEKNLLKLSNFSEDKRKYSHVTAFYGLNQDPKGREKRIGIMRINELILREDEFDSSNVCYVLQNLKRGQPILSSYF